MDIKTVRYLLNDWAMWHVKASGTIRCSLGTVQDVPSLQRPGSRVPSGVDPPSHVRDIIIALGAIAELDDRHRSAIAAIRAVYLRERNAKLTEVATELGIATKTLEGRRQLGEMALLVYLMAKGCRYR